VAVDVVADGQDELLQILEGAAADTVFGQVAEECDMPVPIQESGSFVSVPTPDRHIPFSRLGKMLHRGIVAREDQKRINAVRDAVRYDGQP
jgi:hypothetical protein